MGENIKRVRIVSRGTPSAKVRDLLMVFGLGRRVLVQRPGVFGRPGEGVRVAVCEGGRVSEWECPKSSHGTRGQGGVEGEVVGRR